MERPRRPPPLPGESYYHSEHWRLLRSLAMRRDRETCVRRGCHQKATRVNHKVARPRVPHPTEHDRLDNLECLCAMHDNRFHSEKGKWQR